MRRTIVLIVLLGIPPLLNAQIKLKGKPAPDCRSFSIVEGGGFGVKFGRYLGTVPSALVLLVTLLYGYNY